MKSKSFITSRSDNAIVLNNMTIQRHDLILCRGLTKKIETGAIVHLTGKNGSGKTTLLMLLAGLLPYQDEEESVRESIPMYWQGQPPKTWSVLFLGHLDALTLALSVKQNFDFLVSLQLPIYKKWQRSRIMKTQLHSLKHKALAYFDLQVFQNDAVATLSAGQKKRVRLALLWFELAMCDYMKNKQAFAVKRLWLLDEPFSALDDMTEMRLSRLISKFADMGGRVVLTSHSSVPISNDRIYLT